MVAIINYGLGNLASIKNMFLKIGIQAEITNKKNEILNADKLLLPGVGHFAKGMENLKKSGLIPILEECVFEKKKNILGICLGMQLMTNRSEEGDCEGLGWIDANTLKFEFNDNKLKIPHMGWNNVKFKNNILQPESSQLSTPRFYFVHSYYVTCKNETNVLATCNYGNEFHCGIYKENIFGVQFHPEKSHKYGMNLLKAYNNLI